MRQHYLSLLRKLKSTVKLCLPKSPGKIDPNMFTPYPKNPLLANFIVNIGRADVLGSGVRNLYKYTKIYSGKEPELTEGDVFKTIVPISLSDTSVSDNGNMSDKMSDKMSDNVKMSDNNYRSMLLECLLKNSEISATEAAEIIGRSAKTARRILLQLADEGVVTVMGANRNRKYKARDYSANPPL